MPCVYSTRKQLHRGTREDDRGAQCAARAPEATAIGMMIVVLTCASQDAHHHRYLRLLVGRIPRGWSHKICSRMTPAQASCPSREWLPRQPKIRLSHVLPSHTRPSLGLLILFIRNRTIRNGMNHMNAKLAMFLGHSLRHHSRTRARSFVRCELLVRTHRAQSARENDYLINFIRIYVLLWILIIFLLLPFYFILLSIIYPFMLAELIRNLRVALSAPPEFQLHISMRRLCHRQCKRCRPLRARLQPYLIVQSEVRKHRLDLDAS